MANYCLYFSTPRYDNRDAIVGTDISRGRCYKKLSVAKKALRRELKHAHDELRVDLCAGERWCGHRWAKGGISPRGKHSRKKPTTARQRRAQRRVSRQPGYIPF